jgi:hypothetical protein
MKGVNSSTNVTHTTPLTVNSQFYGATGVGFADSSATLPSPVTVNTILGTGLTGAITTSVYTQGVFDLEGSMLLPPGGYVAVYTSTASGASSFQGSILWEEIPI